MDILHKPDVLIVDDDKDICEIFKSYCESTGRFNKIITASDGSLASMKLQNQEFGLIILDMTMPKKNGFEVIMKDFAGKYKKNKKDNILVISGTLEPKIVTELAANGIKNFMVKPVDETAFKEKVTKMVS
jgi:response regulator of citrate/malate metabolism